MATYTKGTIGYMPAVDQINRKFALRATKCSAGRFQGGNKYMGGATRVTFRPGYGYVNKNIMFFRENHRMSPLSSRERQVRNLFAKVSKGAASILNDISQLTAVQLKYKTAGEDLSKTINGVSAKGYTLRGWVWAVQFAGASESEQYDVNTFPNSFDA